MARSELYFPSLPRTQMMLCAGSPRSWKDFFLVCNPHCSCHGQLFTPGLSQRKESKITLGRSLLPATYLSLQLPSRFSGGGTSIWLSLFQVMRLIPPRPDFTFLIKCVWGYSLL